MTVERLKFLKLWNIFQTKTVKNLCHVLAKLKLKSFNCTYLNSWSKFQDQTKTCFIILTVLFTKKVIIFAFDADLLESFRFRFSKYSDNLFHFTSFLKLPHKNFSHSNHLEFPSSKSLNSRFSIQLFFFFSFVPYRKVHGLRSLLTFKQYFFLRPTASKTSHDLQI